MNRPGSCQTLANELKRYKADLVALQEIRWKDTGSLKVTGGTLLYGDCGDTHEFGTGFYVNDALLGCTKNFKSVNRRLSVITIEAQWFNITLFNVHAPCEYDDDDTKEEFYSELEAEYNAIPDSNVKIVLGDFNAQIGQEDIYKPTIGHFSLHERSNDNGARLINFATENNLIIASTTFEHRRIYKGTWISPDGRIVNQIDHVAFQKRFINSIKDVRTFRGADCDSDHFLVLAKMHIKLKKTQRPRNKNVKLCIDSLKDAQIREEYKHAVEELISRDPTEAVRTDVDENWKELKTILNNVTSQKLEKKKKKDKAWFDIDCRSKVEERKEARKVWLHNMENEENKQIYFRIRRDTQILLRQKKREFYNNVLKEAEDDFTHHRSRQMYQNLKKATGGYKRREKFVKDTDGNILTNDEQIAKRWKDYFSTLLSAPDPETSFDFRYPDTVEPEISPPSFEILQDIINKLKNNKACGEDQIYAELLKAGGDELTKRLKYLIDMIWEQEKIPDEWKVALITPIHKKNDSLNCDNYRGISLLNIAYKVISLAILRQILPFAENNIGNYQSGFRKGKSTIEHIFSLRVLIEEAWEYNQEVHMLFIDFKKAYDSIHRNTLFNIMKELEIPSKLINLTRMCLEETYAKILSSCESECFTISSGLRQGDPCSPVLFNLVLEKIDREVKILLAEENYGIQLNHFVISRLAYADDVVLLTHSKESLRLFTDIYIKAAQKVGLEINVTKSEYMCINRNSNGRLDTLVVNDKIFKQVPNFKYLGSIINNQNNKDEEIQARINAANKAYFSLQQAFKKRSLSKAFKIRLYHSSILPVVLYGCEALTFRNNDEKRLLVFERKVLRRIFGPVFDSISQQWRILKNKEIEERYKHPNIVQLMKGRRLNWAGHLARMEPESIPKTVFNKPIEGFRRRGRPKTRWKDNIYKDVEEMGLDPEQWMNEAQNRSQWRHAVEQAFGRLGPSHG